VRAARVLVLVLAKRDALRVRKVAPRESLFPSRNDSDDKAIESDTRHAIADHGHGKRIPLGTDHHERRRARRASTLFFFCPRTWDPSVQLLALSTDLRAITIFKCD